MAWLQTLSGKAFDLSAPDPRLVDFENDVAPALAKLARFTGHTLGDVGYSVAQHCVLGAESLLEATGSERLAALFLLHDAHEFATGDIPTPVAATLAEIAGRQYGCAGAVVDAIRTLKHRIDIAIFEAADIAMPDALEMYQIKRHDTAMLNAERAVLKLPAPRSWGAEIDAVPAAVLPHGDWDPWEAEVARDAWLDAFERFVGTGE
jgi:uncharacterized protein